MNLFEDIEAENDKYINILDALEFIAKKTNYGVSDIARRLLLDKFNQIGCMFKINDYGKIELWCSEKQFNGDYATTTEFLKVAISTSGTFEYTQTDIYGNEYEHTKDDWLDHYWLKANFFELPVIQKLNIKESDLQIFLNNRSQEALVDFLIEADIQEHEILNKKNAVDVSKTFFKEQEDFKSNEQIETTHIPLFYLNDTFSLIEASCLLSGDNPIQMDRCFNDTNFDQNYPLFNEAYNFINSAVDAGNLSEHAIPAYQLKTYLQTKGRVIDGFNSSLPVQDIKPFLQQKELNIENNEIEYENLRKFALETNNELLELMQVKNNLDDTIFHLNNTLMGYVAEKCDLNEEIEQLKMQLERKNTEIALLKQSAIQTSPPNTKNESKLGTREENNIIKVLAVLADMEKKIDILKPYEAHGIMFNKAQLLGIDKFPSDESIKKWFSKASEYKKS